MADENVYILDELGIHDDDLKCPITLSYFRDPVTASDGYTYERDAITDWINHNSVSPVTSEPLDNWVNPCLIIKKMVDSLEESSHDPYFYMTRYQQNLRQWILGHVKKYRINLSDEQNYIIDDIPDEVAEFTCVNNYVHTKCKTNSCQFYKSINCSYYSIFDSLKLSDNYDDLNINACGIPYRHKIYNYLRSCSNINRNQLAKKIIDSTSPCDDGLKYYLSLEAENTYIYGLLTPELHFKLFDHHMLYNYIESMGNYEQFNKFLNQEIKYIDKQIQKYILTYFVGNTDLSLDCDDVEKVIDDLFEKYVTDPQELGYMRDEPISYISESRYVIDRQYSDNGIKKVHIVIHKLVQLDLFTFSNIYDILDFINKDLIVKKFENTLDLMMEKIDITKERLDNIFDFFRFLGSDYNNISIEIFRKWFFVDNRIFSVAQSEYMNDITLKSLNTKIIDNLCYLMNLSVPITTTDCSDPDLEIDLDYDAYANLIRIIPENIDFINQLYRYLKRQHLDNDILKCAIICNVDLSKISDIFTDIMNTVQDIQQPHQINGKECSIADSLLENDKIMNDEIMRIIIKKSPSCLNNNLLKKIISSKWISHDILILLPINTLITSDLLKCAAQNPRITMEEIKDLIYRMN